MTTDWYLFWKQHYARPTLTPFELEMGILTFGIERMNQVFAEQVAPAFKRMADQMSKFLCQK